MPKANSLYELIKKTYQEKGRPLKIVCDWDEVLHPLKVADIYDCCDSKINFKIWFERFWDKALMRNSDLPVVGNGGWTQSNDIEEIEGNGEEAEEIRNAFKKHEKILKEIRLLKNENPSFEEYKNGIIAIKKKYGVEAPLASRPSVYPFLSIAEQLLRALTEGLVDRLMVISSYRQGRISASIEMKREEFGRTWGKFPQCELELTEITKAENSFSSRWKVLKNKYPDFDVLIDDDVSVMESVLQNFADQPEKILIMPDYKYNRHVQAPNIYHVKTTVSDLKNEDFTQAAQEYQQKHPELASRQAQLAEESIWKQPALYLALGIGICLLGLGVYYLVRRKNKSAG